MYLGIISVEALEQYKLKLTFENNECRILDMKPYLNTGLYKQLKDIDLFNTVRISFDTIEWNNKVDLCPEFAYKNSIALEPAESN